MDRSAGGNRPPLRILPSSPFKGGGSGLRRQRISGREYASFRNQPSNEPRWRDVKSWIAHLSARWRQLHAATRSVFASTPHMRDFARRPFLDVDILAPDCLVKGARGYGYIKWD